MVNGIYIHVLTYITIFSVLQMSCYDACVLPHSVDVTEAEKARLSGDPKRAFDIYTTHLNDLEHNKALVVDQLNKEEVCFSTCRLYT